MHTFKDRRTNLSHPLWGIEPQSHQCQATMLPCGLQGISYFSTDSSWSEAGRKLAPRKYGGAVFSGGRVVDYSCGCIIIDTWSACECEINLDCAVTCAWAIQKQLYCSRTTCTQTGIALLAQQKPGLLAPSLLHKLGNPAAWLFANWLYSVF